jgi:glucose-1-phosphate cytidylyltransferase
MKTVLLAGGLGTRLREETDIKPKPMVMIGNRPLIWHIMQSYAFYGHSDFVICAGYKGEVIKNYFLNFPSNVSDFTIKLNPFSSATYHNTLQEENWQVTISDTGEKTMTGGRLFKIRKYIQDDIFFCTYGDGLSDVNINSLLDFHKRHGKIATITAIRPISRFGVLELSNSNRVSEFREKPQMDSWVNAGFFVFNKKVFDYLDDDSILENQPMIELAKSNQLVAYRHNGYWQPMDTFREFSILNELWLSGTAPWKVWR